MRLLVTSYCYREFHTLLSCSSGHRCCSFSYLCFLLSSAMSRWASLNMSPHRPVQELLWSLPAQEWVRVLGHVCTYFVSVQPDCLLTWLVSCVSTPILANTSHDPLPNFCSPNGSKVVYHCCFIIICNPQMTSGCTHSVRGALIYFSIYLTSVES